MSRQLIYRPNAETDLERILYYLATYSRVAATRFLDRYIEVTQSLIVHPHRGAVEPCDPLGTLRRVVVPGFNNYLVYYRVSTDAVTVLHVFHSARDVPTLLRDSGEV